MEDLRISVLADTVMAPGAKPHGVARFLDDLGRHIPNKMLRVYLPAKSGVVLPEHMEGIDAPQMELPNFPGVALAHPLAHHRKWVRQQLAQQGKQGRPHVVHASTPGPFGLLGRDLAASQSLPWVAIDHTRFDHYLCIVVEQSLQQLAAEVRNGLGALTDRSHSLHPQFQRWLGEPNVERLGRLATDIDAVRSLPTQPEITAIRKSWWRRLRWGMARWWVPGFRQLEEMKDRVIRVANDAQAIALDLFPAALREPRQIGPMARRVVDEYLRWFYRDCTFLIARSEAERTRVEQLVGQRRTRVLRPGIHVERFQPGAKNPQFWKSLGMPIRSSANVVLYVGRVSHEKNVSFLARVSRRVAAARSDVEFVLVGGVAEECRRTLQEIASPRLHLAGALDGEDLIQAYRNADIFAFPSQTETLGQVLLEAMAVGLPVLAANTGGPTAIVDASVGKLLPASRDAHESDWANTLCDWLDNSTQRVRMGDAARERVCREFSWQASADNYLRIHEEAWHAHQDQQRQTQKSQVRARLEDIELPSPTRGDGCLFLSDYHAGKRQRNPEPLRQLRNFAEAHGLRVGLLGDFADHSSDAAAAQEDFAVFREEMGTADWFIRGNHDYGFHDSWLREQLGGAPILQSYVRVDNENAIFATHGHILGLSRELKPFTQSKRGQGALTSSALEELERKLSPCALDEVLKTAIVAHDISSLTNDMLGEQGLSLLQLWEGGEQWRSRLVQQLMSHRATQVEAVEMLAHLLVPREDSARLGQLAAHSCCWLGVYGHTHERDLREHRVSGRQVLVANCGKLYGHTLSCVVARFPQVFTLAWSESNHAWEVWRTQTLEPQQQAHWLSAAPVQPSATS